MTHPQVVALDVVETLFSLDALSRKIREAGLPESAPRLFFAQMLRDAFALEASGVFRPFVEVARASLEVTMASAGVEATPEKISRVLAAFGELDAHPDVEPALARLASAGIRLVALTNGSAQNTARLLERSGLDRHIERTLSIDEVRHWKPNREVYLHAARSAGAEPASVMLIAAHAWDVHGARNAGLQAAWVKRQDAVFSKAMQAPQVTGASLAEIADRLVARA